MERPKPDEVVVGDFVKRQTAESRFSHYDGTWDDLLNLVTDNLDSAVEGVAPHVILVEVPRKGFWSSVVQLERSEDLLTTMEARRPEEMPVLVVTAQGRKVEAWHVEIVLYHHSALPDLDEGWGIVSLNASPNTEPVPMDPITMARNQLEKEGGTKVVYSSEEWAKAVWFWARHARVTPTP